MSLRITVAAAALAMIVCADMARAQTQPTPKPRMAAADQTRRCSDLDGLFKDGSRQGFRPLVTLAPQRRLDAPGKLSVTINARLGNRGEGRLVRVGNYLAHHVPVWEIAPQAGARTLAYVTDPLTGYPCPISRQRMLDPDFQQAWIYGGVLLALKQGDELRTRVTSTLDLSRATAISKPKVSVNGGVPCQATNQHTHGLLVNAWNGDGTRGDYVFDLAKPTPLAAADECGGQVHAHGTETGVLNHVIRIPGRIDDPRRSLETGRHPSGLYWFHPHGHGYSGYQVRGGTTGLITVGLPRDTIDMVPRGRDSLKPGNVRNLMLKDSQLFPDPAAAGQLAFVGAYNPTFCGDTTETSAIFAGGECPAKADPAGRWVYTINGVQYPRFANDVKSFETELWRIANASANVSYRLTLYPKKADGFIDRDQTKRKELQVLSVDGVTVDTGPDKAAPRAIRATEVFLMPGSRATVALSPEPGQTFVLVTETVLTSGDQGGDKWVPVALAEVTWPVGPAEVAARPATRDAAGWMMSARGPAARNAEAIPKAVAATASPGTPTDICDLPNGRERVILFAKRKRAAADDEVFGLVAGMRAEGRSDLATTIFFRDRIASAAASQAGHAGHSPVAARERETVRAGGPVINPASFEAVQWSEMEKLFAATVDRSATATDPYAKSLAPAFGQSPNLSQVCTRLGRTERWVIENWTDEIHNFHIHQTKFAISTDPSPEYFDAPYPYSFASTMDEKLALCRDRKSDETRFSATDCAISNRYIGVLQANHDSVPLPRAKGDCSDGVPGAAKCSPGRVTIVIAFDRQEQLGRYPFHCHILEHEDLGMMGQIDVLPALAKR